MSDLWKDVEEAVRALNGFRRELSDALDRIDPVGSVSKESVAEVITDELNKHGFECRVKHRE